MRTAWSLLLVLGTLPVGATSEEAPPTLVSVPVVEADSTRVIEHDAVVADFGTLYPGAKVENAMASKVESSQTTDGRDKQAIFLHPPAQPADGRARLTFPPLDLPKITPPEKLEIRFASRLSTDISDKKGADGVEYVILANDRQVFRAVVTTHLPREYRVDISSLAGQRVVFRFEIDERKNSTYDQAWWDDAIIVVAGRKAFTTITPPAFGIMPESLPVEPVQRITIAESHTRSSLLVAVMDRNLDLDALVKDAESDVSAQSPVPLAPPIAVGEGPDPINHTLIRILGTHGIPEVQFLAFPPEVRGGVQVESWQFQPGFSIGFAAAPWRELPAEIRIFSRYGGLQARCVPDIPGPYAMAAGPFLPGVIGEQLAVASAFPDTKQVPILFFDGAGHVLERIHITLDRTPSGKTRLGLTRFGPSSPRSRLLLHREGSPTALVWDGSTGHATHLVIGPIPPAARLYGSVYGKTGLLAAGPEPERSSVWRCSAAGKPERIDVGTRENRFWFAAAGAHAGEMSKWGTFPEAKHVRLGRFAHIRTDMDAARILGEHPAWRSLTSYEEWQKHGLLAGGLGRCRDYDGAPPTCWEPCFTHRWIRGHTKVLAHAIDPTTHLPRYVVLDRNNHPLSYREFDNAGFNTGTYAFGMPELDRMYIYPIRAFMKELAVHHRANPEHFVAVEPNHEHEIVSSEQDRDSLGDYNPMNLRGFYLYLMRRHGSMAAINRIYKTPFTPLFFDAPRGRDRGEWDRYGNDNPFYQQWFRYNASVICRRVAETWREGLLAGMPPESLTCHQIPDAYAISSLTAFSQPVQRITPIDWMLTAGTSYGFTRYGVWYQRKHNCIQGSWSSGFGMVTVGEYSALATEPRDAYEQLMYLHQHGTMFIHCMWWPAKWEKGRGYNDTFKYALQRLTREDPRRRGVTGGVGSARPCRLGKRAFDIVSLGTGSERNGLLKSVRADGTWEGSIYAVPFHAHVEVTTILQRPKMRLDQNSEFFTPDIRNLSSGTQVEISFTVEKTRPQTLLVDVVHEGDVLPDQRLSLPVAAGQHGRLVLRFQQPMGKVNLRLRNTHDRLPLREVLITRQRDLATRIREGVFEGTRHRGGITFCILDKGKSPTP